MFATSFSLTVKVRKRRRNTVVEVESNVELSFGIRSKSETNKDGSFGDDGGASDGYADHAR